MNHWIENVNQWEDSVGYHQPTGGQCWIGNVGWEDKTEGTVEMSGNEWLMKSVGYPVFTVNNQFDVDVFRTFLHFLQIPAVRQQVFVSFIQIIADIDWLLGRGGERPSHMSHLDEEAKSGKDLLERSWGTSSQLQGVIKLSKHEPDILQFCKYILNSGTFCYDPTYTSGDGNVGWITDGTLGPF